MRARTELTEQQTDRAAWIVAGGERVGGPRAVGLFAAVVWHTSVPLLVWRLPVVPWLLDRLYEWIARHRGSFPGRTPWCVDHPHACEPPPD